MNASLFLQGLGLGAGLIIAIGAQNAYVLRQGLKREHHLGIAAVCALSDALLITLGGAGVGTLIASTPVLASGAAALGAAFLLVYGALAFRRAWVGEALNNGSDAPPARTLKSALLTALAFSLLNPHALLDTVVLLGSISGQYAWDARVWFLTGAMIASFTWFFTLAFAAGYLAPLFRKPNTWRILDGLIGCVMWAIAASLLNGAFL
ncbi:MAG: LysE/ArgO family amino acid transporter [Rhodospirillales bacterium]|nr:LysE/ArgO family amino acid transporter [Rhodospirillales bacterium]